MRITAALLALLVSFSTVFAARADKDKREMWSWMDTNAGQAADCAMDIWNHPELGEMETFSSERLARFLEEDGFTIERGVANIPTAWVATFTNGNSGPTIGWLAEFDALPGLSQEAGNPVKTPINEGAPGQGCGHNLLGTASAYAARAVKRTMLEKGIEGTIKVFGCPAEETLVGKIYMTRDGVFDGVDAMLGWHPGTGNGVTFRSSLAMSSIKFKFFGKTAHGAGDPHHGRSALDAVELMDTGVNFMREHVIDKARIHYVITNGGGAPNVVPDVAEVWYFVRAPRTEEQRPILEWVREIASGAAKMTQTRLEETLLTAGYEVLLNDPLAELLDENLKLVGPPVFDQADWAFAEKLAESFDKKPEEALLDTTLEKLEIVPPDEWKWGGGSTDDGDVSWNVPYGRISTACAVNGTPWHAWQVVACTGNSIGMKGMQNASKVLAGGGLDLLTQPKWISRAKADFIEKLDGRTYQCGVPDSLLPPGSR